MSMSGNAVARYARSAATVLVLSLVTLLAPTTPAQAQTADGDLDTSFSDDGKAIYGRTTGKDGLYHVFTQSNGDLVLSGWDNNNTSNSGAVRWANVEVNSSGSGTGLFSNPDDRLFWSPRSDEIWETLLMSDGRYVHVGAVGTHTTSSSKDYDCAVAVRKANGDLDTTGFNSSGWLPATVTLSTSNAKGRFHVAFSTSVDDKCWAGAVQSDDKIIVAGYVSTNSADIALARVNTDGRWTRRSAPAAR